MKKILLITSLVLGHTAYGQIPVDSDSLDNTTSTTNAQYGLVFDNTTKKIYYMTMDYYQPMVYSSGLVRPRATPTNMIIGGTVNTYGNKLYVVGTHRVSGYTYLMDRVYIGSAGTSYIYQNLSTGAQTFYDPITGNKTLAELAAFDSTVSEVVVEDTLTLNDIKIYENGDSVKARNANGVIFALGRGGTGTGILDTTGLPVATQIAYFTAADKVGSTANIKIYTDSTSFAQDARFNQDIYYKKFGTLADTMAAIFLTDGRVDSISITFGASDAWNVKQRSFWKFFRDSKREKTLPQFRVKSYRDSFYKIEYTLEEIVRYLHKTRVLGVVAFLLLLGYIVYLHVQIRKK